MVRDTQKIINKNNMYGYQLKRIATSRPPFPMYGTVQPRADPAPHHGEDQGKASYSRNERDIPCAARTI